jgi:ArsR family transcriptional regulator, arsenate/arsenite/antimonite-responsive transcriptional repressor
MLNKKEVFEENLVSLAAFAKALSHPARVAILKILADRQQCICGELVESLPLAQSTVSQHLKALKEAGLIQGEIEGVRSCYCLDWEQMEKMLQLFQTEVGALKKGPTSCGGNC